MRAQEVLELICPCRKSIFDSPVNLLLAAYTAIGEVMIKKYTGADLIRKIKRLKMIVF